MKSLFRLPRGLVAAVAFAVAAGWNPANAVALGLVMAGRSAPAVATVRAFLRAAKTGKRSDAVALTAGLVAWAVTLWLAVRGLAPGFAVVAMTLLFARSLALLVAVRPEWRARTLGMIETGVGIAFVAGLAASWGA